VQKRMFKVLAMIPKRGGGTHWSRIGTGFTNRDDSINIYLDLMPKNFELQLRELDDDDLRKRESSPPRPAEPANASPSAPTS